MLFAANGPTLRLWLGASVALLACQSGLFAQIGKVNCQDQPCCPSWPQWKLLDCVPCKHRVCPPLGPNFGYHQSTWQLWPGTKANVSYETKQDLMLNQPTLLPESSKEKSSPGGAAMPAKEPEPQARGPAAHFPTPLTTLPALPEEGTSAESQGTGPPKSPRE